MSEIPSTPSTRSEPGSASEGPAWPRVSVIIPVFGASRTLDLALTAVRAQTYPDLEIICADDGSRDRSGEILGGAGVKVVAIEHAGPAAARNRAVEEATGDILFFTDADVEIFPDTVELGVRRFLADPDLDALFGSYTAHAGPGSNFLTRYKNYLHHFTHQTASPDAFTFWTGCGFVRRSVFDELSGFDPGQRFLSDVEFGYRMHLAGKRVRVDRDIQVVHHKRYDLAGLLRSDFHGRAVPWTRLMMKHRTVKQDLNLKPSNVLSVPLSYLVALALLTLPVLGVVSLAMAVLGLGVLAVLNRAFLGFVRAREGLGGAVAALLVQWGIYLLSGVGVAAAVLGYSSGGR